MRIGILPERIYKRSVDRIIHKYNKDKGIVHLEMDCTFLCVKTGRIGQNLALWPVELEILAKEAWLQASVEAGGKPGSMQIVISLPPTMEEAELRLLMEGVVLSAGTLCLGIEKVCVKTEPDIVCPHITFVLLGRDRAPVADLSVKDKKEKLPIIQIGLAGYDGGRLLALQYEERLLGHYSADYVRRLQSNNNIEDICSFCDFLSELEPKPYAASWCKEGGFYAGLWELGEQANAGLCVEHKDIQIAQETVEICDYLDIDPYMLFCGECLLLAAEDAQRIVITASSMGLHANIIGYLTTKRDRVIINNSEKRFLTEPKMDEIYKYIEHI